MRTGRFKLFALILGLTIVAFGSGIKTVAAQDSPSVLYVPLIGLTSVPDPLALPDGAGDVTYHYAVKNFLSEAALTNVQVVDDNCASVKFIEGDDNNDSELDYDETWRYTCTTKVSVTTQSTATATGTANNLTATHKAYVTVIVGLSDPAPLVSIVNITKVAYPLSLPAEGGDITFIYKVNNPGVVSLSDVTVVDDRCGAMSGKLGDRNGNGLLDTNEVWIYTCTMTLRETTTNTATVTAFANGLMATNNFSLTVKVDTLVDQALIKLPDTGKDALLKIMVWEILLGILVTLLTISIVLNRKNRLRSVEITQNILDGGRK